MSEIEKVTVNREYKDRLLNFIFGSEENRKWTLSLYNGLKETEDEVILKLSDSFKEELREQSDVEVKVSMLNINYGHNEDLLNTCRPLGEYAWFIEKIREYLKDFAIEKAVRMAISNMPEVFLIKPFLMIHRAEAQGVKETPA